MKNEIKYTSQKKEKKKKGSNESQLGFDCEKFLICVNFAREESIIDSVGFVSLPFLFLFLYYILSAQGSEFASRNFRFRLPQIRCKSRRKREKGLTVCLCVCFVNSKVVAIWGLFLCPGWLAVRIFLGGIYWVGFLNFCLLLLLLASLCLWIAFNCF